MANYTFTGEVKIIDGVKYYTIDKIGTLGKTTVIKHGDDGFEVIVNQDSINNQDNFNSKFKIDTIILEGVDKTGKDTLVQYIDKVCNHKYAVYQRGNISNNAYAKIFNRQTYNYNMSHNALYVLLSADAEDLKIRFKITNEPNIDIKTHLEVFEDTFAEMTKGCYTAKYNTSELTPYKIAKSIVDFVDNINEQNM